ncbi:WW domain-containing protein [Ditylenchus destructor]|uniref:WW domain-containing protein n=1 Tax=Ditylenchus destructor TaxID=166010 RepID=A0AAD4MZZ0_9BILA|nr:WW domain-containing protein [Ditylenchus destructor]
MPLPPLLLARLKQRGIIKEQSGVVKPGAEEEVFAESYDKDEDNEEVDTSEKYRGGAPGCPNKYNHYHLCTDFCFDHWREGYSESSLSQKYRAGREKLLKDYPLPPGWREVYDAGMRRHYYWCQATDEVSWLSPKHPKAVISEAAPKVAREMLNGTNAAKRSTSVEKRRDRETDDRDDYRGRSKEQRHRGRDHDRDSRRRKRDESVSDEDRRKESGEDEEPEVEMSERDKLKRAKRRGIDPMDPAAYGDAPKGNWSSGLTSDVKTGVDVTANGPLFQARPLPAPGAILRKNNPNYDKKND